MIIIFISIQNIIIISGSGYDLYLVAHLVQMKFSFISLEINPKYLFGGYDSSRYRVPHYLKTTITNVLFVSYFRSKLLPICVVVIINAAC